MIYAQKSQRVGEMDLQITDISLSPDNNLIAITTSDSILIYDIKKDSLSKLYTENEPADTSYTIFDEVKFSPDQKHLLITKLHYEGQSTIIFNLDNNTITDTGYFGYGYGVLALDWLSSDKLIGLTYGSGKDYLFWFTPDNFDKKFLFQTGYLSSQTIFDPDSQKTYYTTNDNSLFYYSIKTGQSVPIEKIEGFSLFGLSDDKDHLIFSKNIKISSKLSEQLWAYNLTNKNLSPIFNYLDNLR